MNCELLQIIFLRNAVSILVCISSWHIVFITITRRSVEHGTRALSALG